MKGQECSTTLATERTKALSDEGGFPISVNIEQPIVSVLIAVHNSEKWLHECLDSLRNQTMPYFEAICIDDCSDDNSIKIIKHYEEMDKRFKVITLNENHGQAYARNQGLAIARGKYTCFLDSDDYFSHDALQKAINTIEKAQDGEQTNDCVMFRVINFYDSANNIQSDYPGQPFARMSGYEAFEKSLAWDIHGVYMVRTSIHREHPYDDTCKVYSDDNTTRIHYLASNHVDYCEGIYYYRQHPSSSTHAISISHFEVLKANESMKRQLTAINSTDSIMRKYEDVRWLNVIGAYMFYYQNRKTLGKEASKKGLNEIKRIWLSIETNMISRNLTRKFGYIPFRKSENDKKNIVHAILFSHSALSWSLFCLQEEIYFFLRKLRDIALH